MPPSNRSGRPCCSRATMPPRSRAMGIGIDWVSLGIFVVAYAFAQVKAAPVRLRYAVLAGACGIIAAYRMRTGAQGINLVFVGLALALCVFYLIKAIRAAPRQ